MYVDTTKKSISQRYCTPRHPQIFVPIVSEQILWRVNYHQTETLIRMVLPVWVVVLLPPILPLIVLTTCPKTNFIISFRVVWRCCWYDAGGESRRHGQNKQASNWWVLTNCDHVVTNENAWLFSSLAVSRLYLIYTNRNISFYPPLKHC